MVFLDKDLSEVQNDEKEKSGQSDKTIDPTKQKLDTEIQNEVLDVFVTEDGKEITGSKLRVTQGSSAERVEELKLLYPPKYTDPDGNPSYLPPYWFDNMEKREFEGKRQLTGFMYDYFNSTMTCENFRDLAKEYSWSEKYEEYIYQKAITECIYPELEEDEDD